MAVGRELGVTEMETDAETPGFVEQRLCARVSGIFPLEESRHSTWGDTTRR